MSDSDQKQFFKTGITVLDQKLGGRFSDDVSGIPSGSIVLIYVPPETNLGTLFAQRIALNLVEQNPNSKAYYLNSSRPQVTIKREFKAYNWDVASLIRDGRWEFIDMWDITSSHVASSSKIGKIDIRRKTYLKQAFKRMKVEQKSKDRNVFSVVDNLLWLKEDEFDDQSSKVLDYFKEITDLVMDIGGIHFFILPKGILSKTSENILISMVNGIIEFSREVSGNKNQDRLSVIKMIGVSYESEILEITPDSTTGLRIESTGKI